MEFNFSIAPYFPNNIAKVGPRLIPDGFTGDRRDVQMCHRMSTILTEIGESSAKAQGLQRVITSGDRLRNSDHIVYLIVDTEGGVRGNGTVLGMLKTGIKHLYLFDSSGNSREVYANCVLDFYVHESKQRMGLGKQLFEQMLNDEGVLPHHLAIDKPSPKLISFLDKHYGLSTIIPQMNNFVLFEGFFDDRNDSALKESKEKIMAAGVSSSTSRYLSGGLGTFTDYPEHDSPRQSSRSPSVSSTPFGRSTPHRPVSTMGFILQNQAPVEASTTPSRPIEEEKEVTEEEPEGQEAVDEVEEKLEELSVAEEVEPEPEVIEVAVVEPLPCKVQAAGTPTSQHLDLKFYHSSLW